MERNPREERQWAEGIAAGRPDALEAAYDAFSGSVYRQALAILSSPSDAEDVMQEVFLKVARKRGPAIRELKAYLLTAARNEAYSLLRRRRFETDSFDLDGMPQNLSDSSHRWEDGGSLQEALTALPLEQREVVTLKVYEGMTFEEIARIVDAPTNTVASRYRYALQKLRRAMEGVAHRG